MNLSKTYVNAKRSLLWLQLQTQYYFIAAGCAFVVFFILGVIPMVKQARAKYELIQDMKAVNENLSQNVAQLDVAASRLQIYGPFIDEFRLSLPNTYSIQDYLTNLDAAAASANFVIRNFRFSVAADDYSEYDVTFAGDGSVQDLVRAIEQMRSTVTIVSVSSSLSPFSDNKYNVSINLHMYTL